MTENTIPTYDKSTWRKGEWDNESDRVDFVHAGFSCFILRNNSGNWCGYVGVPNTHPMYGKHYDSVDVEVHGGLTYSDFCHEPICHVPTEGMSDDVWWLGFDTAHMGDITPSFHFTVRDNSVYRTENYTVCETKHLAEQLKELGEKK